MAVTVDAATVALVTTTSGTAGATTASFNTPANCRIIVLVGYDAGTGDAAGDKAAVTNNKSLTVTEKVEHGNLETTGIHGGTLIAYMDSASAQTGMTVTVTTSAVNSANDAIGFKVLLLTGHDTAVAPVDSAENGTTTNAPSLSVTSTIADGVACWAVEDWQQLGAPTWSGGAISAGTFDIATEISGGFAYKAITATGSQTATYDAPGTAAAELSWCAVTVQAAAAAATIPWRRPRGPNYRR